MKARLVAIKGLCEYPFKVHFPNIYNNDNYMACYKLCQQYNDYFTPARAKKPNLIFFAISFFQDRISFC